TTRFRSIYEYIPPSFRKLVLMRQTLACQCGKVITTEAPARVGLKTRYAPSFVAHLCTSKLADSIPQHRLEKEYKRLEIPIPRSTMNALLHRAADELEPLHAAACALVRVPAHAPRWASVRILRWASSCEQGAMPITA